MTPVGLRYLPHAQQRLVRADHRAHPVERPRARVARDAGRDDLGDRSARDDVARDGEVLRFEREHRTGPVDTHVTADAHHGRPAGAQVWVGGGVGGFGEGDFAFAAQRRTYRPRLLSKETTAPVA
eukprot:123411-Prymnesium_polylepis.2